ncbi:MAG: type II toxin-antitoxin system VapC family toxin [Geminicoccales bacterium]
MNYLLDTHVLLWWLDDDPRLSSRFRDEIGNPHHDIVVSAASLWEAAIKRAIGKLRFETPVLLHALRGGRLRVLPISSEHALAAGDLPRHHDDPFDRMLVAQAIVESLTIISHDRHLDHYDVDLVRA